MQKLSKHFYLILIILHLIITIPLAYNLNIWMDEASTLYTTQQGFTHTFQNVFHTEKQAPLYFLLLSLWRDIDDSFFFARLFSIICSCFAIKFFFDLTKKLFNENQAILITTFFALHPFLIWISLEIRVYTMIVLLSVLLFKFFEEGYLNQSASKRSRVAFIITAIIGLYTNYYLGFLLVGGFLGLLVLRRWKLAQTYFLQMFIVGLAILPLVWAIQMQIEINTDGHKEVTNFVDGLKLLWGHLLTFVFPTELMPTDEKTIISFIRIWLVRLGILAVILLVIKNKFRDLDEKVLLFGIFSAVIFGFMMFAFSLLGGDYLALRHATVLFVPITLLIASMFANLFSSKVWIVMAIIFTFLFAYSIYNLYPSFAKRGDWINIAKFIEANEKSNQPIIIDQAFDALSLPYHYKGVNQILPNERFFDWVLEDSITSENGYRKQIAFIISEIPPNAQYIWLITRDTCHIPETAPSCRPLENFVQAHYTIEIEKDFYLEKLRLLRKKND